MPRKASHGWSFRQQGGFRSPGPVKIIYQSDTTKNNLKKKVSPKVNQNLTLAQAANIGASISFQCLNCKRSKYVPCKELVLKFPKHADAHIKIVSQKATCAGCKSRDVKVSYVLASKFRKRDNV